jgi:hypothetical protein
MPRVTLLGLCLPTLIAGGCGPGSNDGFAAELVGSWSDCEDASARFTFGEDGSFAFDEESPGDPDGDHISGTYSADATIVAADVRSEADVRYDYQFSYHVTGDRLVFGARHPDGEHDGVIGTWRRRVQADGDDGSAMGGDTVLVLAADGTGTLTNHPIDGTATETLEGTWGEDDDDQMGYELSIELDGGTVNLHFDLIDDAVLGTPSYCLERSATSLDGVE